MIRFVSPLPGIEFELSWGPWAGTHRRGQNWQSGSAWDLHVPAGLPLRSPINGKVVSVGKGTPGTRFAGSKVGISNGECSVFMTHLSNVSVEVGDVVQEGERIGTTGSAVGVEHLHIAMGGPNYWDSRDANGVDPRPYLINSSVDLKKNGPHGYPLFRGAVPEHAAFNRPTDAERAANKRKKATHEIANRLKNKAGFGMNSVRQILRKMGRIK